MSTAWLEGWSEDKNILTVLFVWLGYCVSQSDLENRLKSMIISYVLIKLTMKHPWNIKIQYLTHCEVEHCIEYIEL